MKLTALSPYLLAISLLLIAIQMPGFAQPRAFIQPQLAANTATGDLSTVFITDCKTKGEYGLYSYFIFPRPPVFNAHTRAIEQTEQLLRKIHKLKQHYLNTPASKQHTFYIPVSFEPQSWVIQPAEDDYNAAARWLVHNFDHQCAKKLLTVFPQINNTGPYILSSTRKLGQASPWRMPVLTQDFSNITLDESTYWLDVFFKKSQLSKSWGNMDLLNLRKNIQAHLFRQYSEKKQKRSLAHNNQNTLLQPTAATQIEAETTAPASESPYIEANPYFDKITIQLKRDKQVRN